MKTKATILVLSLFLLASASFLLYSYNTHTLEKDYCNQKGTIFLLPSERQYASGLMEQTKVNVVIPEENEVHGKTESLNCPDVNLDLNYIK
jgi:hypothetical protein